MMQALIKALAANTQVLLMIFAKAIGASVAIIRLLINIMLALINKFIDKSEAKNCANHD
jgi:hypothetical protein